MFIIIVLVVVTIRIIRIRIVNNLVIVSDSIPCRSLATCSVL